MQDLLNWLKGLLIHPKEINTMADTVVIALAVDYPNAQAVKAAVDKVNPVYYAGEDVERIFDVAKYAADKLGIEVFGPVIQHLKSLVKPVTPE